MNTRKFLLPALFCALLIVGAFIKVPLPPVPITLQTLFVLLLGLTCPWQTSLAAVAVYLLIGLVGFPVFTSGGGPGALFGPTGGFLLSWLPASVACALISRNGDTKHPIVWDIVAVVISTAIIYAIGVPYLKYSRSLTWMQAFSGGMFPFLIGDTVKAVVAILLARPIRKKTEEYLHQND